MDNSNNRELLSSLIDKKFNKVVYKEFLEKILSKKINEQIISKIKKEDYENILNIEFLTEIEDSKSNTIGFYNIELSDDISIEKSRNVQRKIISFLIDRKKFNAVVCVFFNLKTNNWRISFNKREIEILLTKTGGIKIEKKYLPFVRYSFLIGEDHQNHTAKKQLLLLLNQTELSIATLDNVFSVEAISKEFYYEYRKLFELLKTELDHLLEKNKKLKDDFEKKLILTENFAKKTLGQIVFIYFIQKKGWLGNKEENNNSTNGDKNFLRNIYNDYKNNKINNFFNDVLENLLYNGLNKERKNNYYKPLKCKIPFLNGGLFEPLHNYDWETTNIKIKDDIIEKILDCFDRYQFTIKEDEPLEKDVAIDPEMLGKVFENLLDENIRKGDGTFYTPRKIVQYISRRTLSLFLAKKCFVSGIVVKENTIFELFNIAESFENLGVDFAKSEFEKSYLLFIDKCLQEITICDPAIGSGAFPVIIMQDIINLRLLISKIFNLNYVPYQLKRFFIENNLYGVDKDDGACEIAKLRMWLSLCVDEDNQEHIAPLPNLDFKIIQGNSLIENVTLNSLIDLSINNEKKEINLFDQISNSKKEELKSLQRAYLNTFLISEKNKLKRTTEKKISELIQNTTESNFEFNLNNNKNFLLWEIMFPNIFDKGGFDLIIGNPPYIFTRKIKDDEKEYYTKKYLLTDYQINTYKLFIELGDKLLNKNGFLGYITPNNWMTLENDENVRRFILNKYFSVIINVNGKTFENVAVDNSIFIFSKEISTDGKTEINETSNNKIIRLGKVKSSLFLNYDHSIISINLVKNPKHLELINFLNENSLPLHPNYCEISDGAVIYETGKGTPKQKKEDKEKKIFHSEIKKNDDYMPSLSGKDLQRYFVKPSGGYVRYGPHLAAPRNPKLYNGKRILLRKICGSLPYMLNCAYLDYPLFYNQTVKIAKSHKIHEKAIVVILNSIVSSYYVSVGLGKMQRETFPQISPADIKKFIIPKNIEKNEQALIELYDKREKNDITDEKIDKYVMKLFNISEEQEKLIKDFCFNKN